MMLNENIKQKPSYVNLHSLTIMEQTIQLKWANQQNE